MSKSRHFLESLSLFFICLCIFPKAYKRERETFKHVVRPITNSSNPHLLYLDFYCVSYGVSTSHIILIFDAMLLKLLFPVQNNLNKRENFHIINETILFLKKVSYMSYIAIGLSIIGTVGPLFFILSTYLLGVFSEN